MTLEREHLRGGGRLRVKTLEEFSFSEAPHLPVALVRNLAEGGYLQRSERSFFLGKPERAKPTWRPDWRWKRVDRGSGCVSPPRPAMVNELIEAKNNSELNRVTRRWTRYELIVIDEMAYVAMPETNNYLMMWGAKLDDQSGPS
jgi:hypothetical protein